MTENSVLKAVRRSFCNSPDRSRLDGEIKEALIALAQCGEDAQKEEWWPTADQHLKRAQEYLAAGTFQQAWVSLQSAQRAVLLNSKCPCALKLAAIELR